MKGNATDTFIRIPFRVGQKVYYFDDSDTSIHIDKIESITIDITENGTDFTVEFSCGACATLDHVFTDAQSLFEWIQSEQKEFKTDEN